MTNKMTDLPSLILEGGTFRTIYTAGILDAFIEHDLEFPYVVAISAGAINACSYASKQKERTFRIFHTYRDDKRYMGIGNFLKEKSYFGLNFAYDTIPNELDIFDWETFRQYNGTIEFGVTNAYTGKVEYMNAFEMDTACTMLRATCALPMFFPEILINDIPYYDGGLADPVPIRRTESLGYTKHIIVLTRPKGYRKEMDWQSKLAIKSFTKKYPRLAKTMLARVEKYNETMDYIEQLEENGNVFVFRPNYALKSFEKKKEVFTETYQMGYTQAISQMDALKQFIAK